MLLVVIVLVIVRVMYLAATAKAGATCLRLIAQLVEDDVVDLMVPFVTVNIASQTNWRQREAAVMAFGAVLEVRRARS